MPKFLIPDEDILWVYKNLENYEATARDAPNSGAGFLLKLARRDEHWFFHRIVGLPGKRILVYDPNGAVRMLDPPPPQESPELEERWPADWWQAFRERWFPAWWLRRWPVRYKSVSIKEKED